MSYCDESKKQLLQSLLNLRALRKAYYMLQTGQRKEAIELIARFPSSTEANKLYKKVRIMTALGPFYSAYLRLKRLTITPLRKVIRSVGEQKPILPPMPYEQDNNEN
jgi:hypothetical protein